MHKRKGFTIIEVTLVIAIAGLILIMVFVALPAMRAQARDTERKEDVAILIDLIKDFQTNHRGALPISSAGSGGWELVRCGDSVNQDEWDALYCTYLSSNFTDPDGERYWLMVGNCNSTQDKACNVARQNLSISGGGSLAVGNPYEATFPNEYVMTVVIGAKCSGNQAVGVSNPRKVAVMYTMERGGLYCANS